MLNILPPPREVSATGSQFPVSSMRLHAAGLSEDLQRCLVEILVHAGLPVSNDGLWVLDVAQLAVSEVGADVPRSVVEQYYELTIDEGTVQLAGGGAQGLLWGAQTLADLAGRSDSINLPAGHVRDWPDLLHRGLFIEDKWGPDRMLLADWQLLVDRLARLKMNTLGIGLYGCWGGCRFEGQPTEFLMVPIPGQPQLQTPKHLRWYSPCAGAWREEHHLPRMFEEDFLGKVVAYGQQRGVTVVPFVNSLGHNTMIPRLLPEVSARDADGTTRQIGYCLSTPATRDFIEGFYGSILARYYPDGADLFHIQLDEVWPEYADLDDPHKRVDPWCQCPACSQRSAEENLQDYILWLVQMLIDKGVGKVVMWNDQLTRHMDALDSGFAARLRDAGLTDRLILHWWWYNNEALNERTRVAIGRDLGLSGWVAPMTCYFNWERYSPTRRNIELMMAMGHEEGGEGAVAYSVHDPAWADHEMLLASYGWNFAATGSAETNQQLWARACFGDAAEAVLAASADICAAAARPSLARCYYYRYSYCQPDGPWPRPYPGLALDAIEALRGDSADELHAAAQDAGSAVVALLGMLEGSALGPHEQACLRSLAGVAARIQGLAGTFSWLLRLRAALAAGTTDARLANECARRRDELLGALTVMEDNMPSWLVPSALMGLGPLLSFLEQLPEQLSEVASGRRAVDALVWHADWTV
jgi:hypothetical protein